MPRNTPFTGEYGLHIKNSIAEGSLEEALIELAKEHDHVIDIQLLLTGVST